MSCPCCGYEPETRSLTAAIMQALRSHGVLPYLPANRSERTLYELVRALVGSYATQETTVSAASRRLHRSTRALARQIESTGLSPLDLITLGRLLRATELLQSPPFPDVFSVARETGFSDGFCLSNRMKAKTGYRPSETRDLDGWRPVLDAYLERNRAPVGASP